MKLTRAAVMVSAAVLCACASETPRERKSATPAPARDVTLDLGKGDSIRFIGAGDSFDRDDPAYSGVDKVETLTLQFADGTTKRLCKRKGPGASEEQLTLARQYVAARAGVLSIPEVAPPASLGDEHRRLLKMIVADFLRQHCHGANCSPDHPEWKRAAAVIEQDLQDMLAGASADPKLRTLPKQVEETFVTGMAARLTPAELREIKDFYSRSPGAQFARVQERMVTVLTSGMATIYERLLKPPPPSPQPRLDAVELKELLGLFDEAAKIQLAILDPGPGKDRSGLQAIPMMIMLAVQDRFDDLNAIWKELPAEQRSAIVAWRDSPLARKERAAILESARSIRTFFDPSSTTNRLTTAGPEYEKKWRALIHTPRQ